MSSRRRVVLVRIAAVLAVPIALVAWLFCDCALGIAYAAVAPIANVPAVAGPLQHRELLVLGDSLGSGFRSTPGHGWVDIFRYRIAERDSRAVVINAAVPGSRVRDLLPQLERSGGSATAVFVVAGGNDLMDYTDPWSFARNDHALLAAIRARFPHARILVANVPDISWRSFHLGRAGPARPLPAPLRASLAMFTNVDNAIVDRTADRFGAQIVDLHGLTLYGDGKDPGVARIGMQDFAARYVSFDGLHPNDRGYALLADFAWPQIAKAMSVAP